jgi:hypothetical protein
MGTPNKGVFLQLEGWAGWLTTPHHKKQHDMKYYIGYLSLINTLE